MDNKISSELLSALMGSERRYLSYSCAPGELREIQSGVKSLADWHRKFYAAGEKFEKIADLIGEDRLTKSTLYLRAAIHYHISQTGEVEDTAEKKRGFFSAVRAYKKGAPYFWVPVEVVEYPFRNIMMQAYFRKAPGPQKAPCVILIKGIDSSSEAEGHCIADYFLQKGLSTFDIDCPGQYMARFRGLAMTPDFEKPVSAAIDYLQTRSDIDLDRIAIFGSSFGGFIGPRAAAFEKRIKACISTGGFYSLDEFDFNNFFTLHLINDLKITPDEYPKVRKQYTLEGILDKVTCPLLVVNGAKDTTMPVSATQKIYDKAKCDKEIRLYEGLNHCAWVEKKTVLSEMGDWLNSKLA